MASTTNRLSLDKYSDGEDWDHSDTVDQVDEVASVQLLDSGTFTLSGGSSPAASETITGVSSSETSRPGSAVLNVDSTTSHSADYEFSFGSGDMSTLYDQSDGEWDVTLTVNWDTDPGGGNDVTVSYRIYEE